VVAQRRRVDAAQAHPAQVPRQPERQVVDPPVAGEVFLDALEEAIEAQQTGLEQPGQIVEGESLGEDEQTDDDHRIARGIHPQPGTIDARHPLATHFPLESASVYMILGHYRGGSIMAEAGEPDTDLSERFQRAVAESKTLSERPDNTTLLKLYALYKQATTGDVEGDRPGFTDLVGRAKWDAWKELAGTGRDEAMRRYVDL